MAGNRKKISIVLIVCLVAACFCSGSALGAPYIKINWASSLKTGDTASKKKLNFSTPVVVDKTIYIGNSGGYLYAISCKKGKKIWETRVDGPIYSKVAFDNGALYFGDGKGVVYSVNAESGEVNWYSFIGEEVVSAPAIDEKNIFIATENNSLIAIDRTSGNVKWRSNRAQPFMALQIKAFSDPVIAGNKIIVGNTDGVLVSYDKESGKKLNILPLSTGRGTFSDIDAAPLITGNDLFVSTMEGSLYSVNFNTGKDNWSVPIGTPNNIVFENGRLYVTAEGKVYCINAANGENVWTKDLDVPELSQVALIDEGHIVVISTNDKVFLLDRATGEVLRDRHLGSGSFGSPVFHDNKVLVLTNSGELYSFRIK